MAKFISGGGTLSQSLKRMFLFLGNVATALAGIGGFLLLVALIPFFYLIDVLSKLWKLWMARERRNTHTFIYEPPRH